MARVAFLLWLLLLGISAASAQAPRMIRPTAHPQGHAAPAATIHQANGCSGAIPAIPPATPRIRAYNDALYTLAFLGFLWEAVGLWLLLHLGFAANIRTWVHARAHRLFWRIALLWCVVSGLMALWRLPPAFAEYVLDRKYGFATLGLFLWLGDRLRGWLFGLAAIPMVWIAWVLLLRSPRRWWIWLWLATIPWSVFTTVLQPVVVDPAYNRFTQLPQGKLRSQIAQLAARAGVGGAQILVADASRRTTRSNAYVTGIGPTRRIVLWNTTIRALPADEVLFVVAHEIGHYVLGHLWWLLAGNVAGSFALLAVLSQAYPWAVRRWGPRWHIESTTDLAALPVALLVLQVLFFAQLPAAGAYSRFLEHQADRYGLDLTHDNCAAARLFADFVRRDYADPDPPRIVVLWFYTHPPVRDRLRFALTYHPWTGSAHVSKSNVHLEPAPDTHVRDAP